MKSDCKKIIFINLICFFYYFSLVSGKKRNAKMKGNPFR